MTEEWMKRIGPVEHAQKFRGIARRRKTADDVAARVDLLREAAEEADMAVGLHVGELPAEPFGPRAIIGIEPRQIWSARGVDGAVERRHDALRGLADEADTAVAGRERIERVRGFLVGAIVDDQELEVAESLRQYAFDRFPQPLPAVAYRHDYRYDRRHRRLPSWWFGFCHH